MPGNLGVRRLQIRLTLLLAAYTAVLVVQAAHGGPRKQLFAVTDGRLDVISQMLAANELIRANRDTFVKREALLLGRLYLSLQVCIRCKLKLVVGFVATDAAGHFVSGLDRLFAAVAEVRLADEGLSLVRCLSRICAVAEVILSTATLDATFDHLVAAL